MTLHRAEELFYRALELQEKNALAEAEAAYREALALAPGRPSIVLNLATVLVGLERHAEAASLCVALLKEQPDDEEALLVLGACLAKQRHTQEALTTFERVLRLNPHSPEGLIGRGNVLLDLDRPEEALRSYESGLREHPDHAVLALHRGNALLALGRAHDALQAYDLALRLLPDHPVALHNRGNALLSLADVRAAQGSYAAAARVNPDYASAQWNDAICSLALGDFARGWDKYEWGWVEGQRGNRLDAGRPWWAGEFVDGTLLAWGEQGVGDQVLFASLIPDLARRARRLLVAVDVRLVSLFARSFPDVEVVAKDENLERRSFQAHIALGSAGKYLRTRWTDFPPTRPAYLSANAERRNGYRDRLPRDKLCVGVSWTSRNNAYAEAKSMQLRDLQPLLACGDMHAVDLQYGDTADERATLHATSGVEIMHLDELDLFDDLDGLAALIDACDAVVTVSNTTAHFAGALGKPTYLLLPAGSGRHWYWHVAGGQGAGWYGSVRPYTQQSTGEWKAVVEQVTADLATTAV